MKTTEALLLDTHVFLWLVTGTPGHASKAAWKKVRAAAEYNALAVSEMSLWEIAVKASKGKLQLDREPRSFLREAMKLPGFGIVEVDRDVLVDSALLDFTPRDPADRVLIVTAQLHGLRLATADGHIIDYARDTKRLRVLDVRV